MGKFIAMSMTVMGLSIFLELQNRTTIVIKFKLSQTKDYVYDFLII